MRKATRTLAALAMAGGTLFGAKEALAASSVHGVAFVHGTGDYPGTQTCSGTGTGFSCTVSNAVSNYWNQGYINSVRGGRPYAVTGHHGGTMTPWINASPYKNNGDTTTGTAYEVAAQLNRFLAGPDGTYGNADDITDLVVETHSGGSNVMRYILQHPTINSNFAHVQARTRKVITAAGVGKGTYLADRVFANDGSLLTLAGSALAGLMGFKDDGTYFIQTANMTSQNADNAKLGNSGTWNSSNQGGVPFYATGGLSTQKCFGVMAWGHCVGITAGSLGGSNCDSFLMDTGLAALHNAFLNTNDSGTARNSCSDGFISCASSQAIGINFAFSLNQDHNQSRRQCNGIDGQIASQVNNAMQGFVNEAYDPTDVPVAKWDSCSFHTSGTLSSGGSTVGYASGCATTDLGDGWCDPDCLATYGKDAPATIGADGRVTWTAGGADDCASTAKNPQASYSGITSTNNPWSDGQAYSNDGTNWYYTQFNGQSHNSTSTVFYSDPWYGTTSATGYCPQSWVGDGTCDECVLATYGNDGNDCLPGKISACGGLVSKYGSLSTTLHCAKTGATCTSNANCTTTGDSCVANQLYNEGDPTTNGSTWYFWYKAGGTVGNGVCDIGECSRNNWNPCAADADCSTGTCSGGYCADSASTCNADTDCVTGTCVNGACTTAGADCSTTKSDGTTQSLCR